jgi:FixJ family two-component response regulator
MTTISTGKIGREPYTVSSAIAARSGLLNKQVGGELGISEITVKAHRGQVMRKMRADLLPDIVTMAARLGLRPALKH